MYRKEKFWIGLPVFLLFIFVGTLVFSIIYWIGVAILISLISGLAFIIFLIPLVYWGLAPLNIFFTFIDEGTAKIVSRGGKFAKSLIQWEGQTFDEDYNVISEGWYKDGVLLENVIGVVDEKAGRVEVKTIIETADGKKMESSRMETGVKKYKEPWYFGIGGLRFYGFWPFDDIYGYRLRWTSIKSDGTPSPHDEVLDAVLLKDHVYFVAIKGAEDSARIPLDINLVITMRVKNPYKSLFKVQDWMELVLSRTQPLFRHYVSECSYEDLLKKKSRAGAELWKKLEEEGLINEFERDYGIEIKDGGIEMRDITPPPEYQKAATQKYLAAREAEKQAGETIGTVIQMLSAAQGIEPDKIRKQINEDLLLQKEFRAFCQDLVHRRMALDRNSYLDIRVGGAEGVEKSLLELISAWRRMPGVKTETKEKAKKETEA